MQKRRKILELLPQDKERGAEGTQPQKRSERQIKGFTNYKSYQILGTYGALTLLSISITSLSLINNLVKVA